MSVFIKGALGSVPTSSDPWHTRQLVEFLQQNGISWVYSLILLHLKPQENTSCSDQNKCRLTLPRLLWGPG